MKKINSKKKGAAGEREFRDLLNKYFPESSRRGQQYCGANGDADVICEALPQFHFEVKRTETLNLKRAIEQSQLDCDAKIAKNQKATGQISIISPVVVHRYSRGKWMAVIEAEELLKIISELEKFKIWDKKIQEESKSLDEMREDFLKVSKLTEFPITTINSLPIEISKNICAVIDKSLEKIEEYK